MDQNLERGESSTYARVLFVVGAIICAIAAAESYFQLSGSEFTLLKAAHEYGFLKYYPVIKEPNRGIWHPMGWVGSACFIIMMFYSLRKRFGFMQEVGPLRVWLDTHIFLGIVGTALVMFHTTFKVGGIVSVSFWSMVLVAVSGFFGRYIYVQIPRSISGKELQINEIEEIVNDIGAEVEQYKASSAPAKKYLERVTAPESPAGKGIFAAFFALLKYDIGRITQVWKIWIDLRKDKGLPKDIKKRLFKLTRDKAKMTRSIAYLGVTQRLLHYWHVFHKPLAVLMFIIMFLHIAVFYIFRIEAG